MVFESKLKKICSANRQFYFLVFYNVSNLTAFMKCNSYFYFRQKNSFPEELGQTILKNPTIKDLLAKRLHPQKGHIEEVMKGQTYPDGTDWKYVKRFVSNKLTNMKQRDATKKKKEEKAAKKRKGEGPSASGSKPKKQKKK